jgi:hypothetical protein
MKIKSNLNMNLIFETISNYTDCYTLESRGYHFYITGFDSFVRLVKHLFCTVHKSVLIRLCYSLRRPPEKI